MYLFFVLSFWESFEYDKPNMNMKTLEESNCKYLDFNEAKWAKMNGNFAKLIVVLVAQVLF